MMLTRVVALKLARHNIRANAVALGIIKTSFGSGNPDFDRELMSMGRTGMPDELA